MKSNDENLERILKAVLEGYAERIQDLGVKGVPGGSRAINVAPVIEGLLQFDATLEQAVAFAKRVGALRGSGLLTEHSPNSDMVLAELKDVLGTSDIHWRARDIAFLVSFGFAGCRKPVRLY